MTQQKILGFCESLALKLDELVAEEYEYEYFDDPIADRRFQFQLEMNRAWYRKQIVECLGGTGIMSTKILEAAAELMMHGETADDVLAEVFNTHLLFDMRIDREGFYEVLINAK